MKNSPVVMLLLFALAAAGCQGNPQVRRVVDSVQAEARQMEDMIYLLEQDIQVLEQDNAKLRRQIERGEGTSGARPATPRRGGILPKQEEIEGPPEVEMPGENPPPSRPATPRPLNRPAQAEPDVGPLLEPPVKKPANGPAGKVKPTHHEQNVAETSPPPKKLEPEVTDKKVTHIQLNPLHTCGMDFDHAPGDDGLSILIEPRNAANQFVPVAAPVSVVVLDTSKNGDDARIARWDFSQEQIAEKLVQGETRGIHLKLPWPGKPPEAARMEVFVRYQSPEGKKLQGEKEIFVALPGQFSQRWTPRPADRQRKQPSEGRLAAANQPRAAAVTSPAITAEAPAEKTPDAKTPPLLVPPAGLSERQSGEKPQKPTWAPTR